MDIRKHSFFKNPEQDLAWLEQWVAQLERLNNRNYQRFSLDTTLGETHVWGLHTDDPSRDTLVIFPGARTTALFWDFDQGLDHFDHPLRIFLVETNGLPNFSDGYSPDIHSLDYGHWAAEVLDKLNIQQAYIAGASFGGLIAMKLGIVHPEKVKAAFLLNPGCLQPFSLRLKNLYYNLLPLLFPKPRTVQKFLDQAVFCKPSHQLSAAAEKLIVAYELFAITRYQDNTQKPYYMDEQLSQVRVDTYLIEGDKDLLFPYEQSIRNAEAKIGTLKAVRVFPNVGHGIETYEPALRYVGQTIRELSAGQSNAGPL
ncbi:MAG: alpha/beta hydrolase [Saprospiraceae bacterium]|nr:alpha/beta hydrolase [Saprospiraceae bacterium]